MHTLARLGSRLVRLVFSPLDRTIGWLVDRPLEWVAAVVLFFVGLLGVAFIAFYYGRPDSSTGWLLGSLLVGAAVGGIYLLTPLGADRFAPEFIRTWFKLYDNSPYPPNRHGLF